MTSMRPTIRFHGTVMEQMSQVIYRIRPDTCVHHQVPDFYAVWATGNVPLGARVECIYGGLPTLRDAGGLSFVTMIDFWVPAQS